MEIPLTVKCINEIIIYLGDCMCMLVKNDVIRQHISYGKLSKIIKMTHKSWPQVSQVLLSLTRCMQQTTATSAKKSKTEERRVFNDSWTHDFLMVLVTNGMFRVWPAHQKCSTLQCQLALSNKTCSLLQQHESWVRKSRMETLLATRQRQQIMMRAPTNSNKNAALASIKIAYLLNKRGR
mgnify:CR=1 FL=1